MKTVGIALGGGGAKGLAHIPMLEVFDELGFRPACIAGTSIGAIVGAIYASGTPAAKIRQTALNMALSKGDSLRTAMKKKDALQWARLLDPGLGRGGLFKGDSFIKFLYDSMGISSFEKLQIPLKIVASDFWTREQVVMESGDLLSALKASMGLPGVFTPVEKNNRVLIDGGGVNPVPHDLLEDCDIVVAVNVMGKAGKGKKTIPNLFRSVLGMFSIMQNSIIENKLKLYPPDIYVEPDTAGTEILDFFKAGELFDRAEPAKNTLRAELKRALFSRQ